MFISFRFFKSILINFAGLNERIYQVRRSRERYGMVQATLNEAYLDMIEDQYELGMLIKTILLKFGPENAADLHLPDPEDVPEDVRALYTRFLVEESSNAILPWISTLAEEQDDQLYIDPFPQLPTERVASLRMRMELLRDLTGANVIEPEEPEAGPSTFPGALDDDEPAAPMDEDEPAAPGPVDDQTLE